MNEIMIIRLGNPVFYQQVLEANKRGFFLNITPRSDGSISIEDTDIFILVRDSVEKPSVYFETPLEDLVKKQ